MGGAPGEAANDPTGYLSPRDLAQKFPPPGSPPYCDFLLLCLLEKKSLIYS